MIDDTPPENKNKEITVIALEASNKEIPYFRIKKARAKENTDKSDRMDIITWFRLHWHSSPKTR